MGDNAKCPVCKRIATRGSFWIECENCFVWFHGICVGLKAKEEADQLKSWVCSRCSQQENFCKDVATGTDSSDTCTFVVVCVCQNVTMNTNSERSAILCSRCQIWYHKYCIRMIDDKVSIICPSCFDGEFCTRIVKGTDPTAEVNKKIIHGFAETEIVEEKSSAKVADTGTDPIEEFKKKMVDSFVQTAEIVVEKSSAKVADTGTDPIEEFKKKMVDRFVQTEKNTAKPLSRLSLSSQQKILPKNLSQSAVVERYKNSYPKVGIKNRSSASSQLCSNTQQDDYDLSDDDFKPKKKKNNGI